MAKKPRFDLRKIDRRQKLMILILVVAMAWGAYYRKFHRPVSLKLHGAKLQLEEVQNKINVLQVEFPNLDLEQEKLRKQKDKTGKMEAELAEIEAGLFKKQDISNFLNELTEDAEGIDFESIRPEEKKIKARERAKELYESYQLEMAFSCRYSELINYVERLQLLSPYLNILYLHVQLEDPKSKRPRTTLRLKTYLKKEAAAVSEEGVAKPEAREIFSAPRTSKPFSPVEKPFEETASAKYKVTGLLWKGGNPVAVVNDILVSVGDKLDEYLVVKIDDKGVVIADEDREYELKLIK